MKLTNEQIKDADDKTICRWIGELILGWKKTTWKGGKTAWVLPAAMGGDYWAFCSFEPLVSHYFTNSMTAAWDILELFIPTTIKVELRGKKGQYLCYIDYFTNEYEALCSTPERAICEAALMARDELGDNNESTEQETERVIR